MKEIKAYIRPERADAVISSLEAAGFKGFTVIDVSMIGSWANPKDSRISMEYCEKYCRAVKIELVCENSRAGTATQTILDHAHSGRRGDGRIFVTNVEDAVNIRTKGHGTEAVE